ncbi:MAG: hypothetical protein ACRC2R_07650 [Xenococcaceae cyanobacterium]
MSIEMFGLLKQGWLIVAIARIVTILFSQCAESASPSLIDKIAFKPELKQFL